MAVQSYVRISQGQYTDLSPGNTYNRTQYFDGNLMYSPGNRFTVGGGIIWDSAWTKTMWRGRPSDKLRRAV